MNGRPIARRELTFQTLPVRLATYCVGLGQAMTVPRGAVLARQGDAADRCYYIRRGFARVTMLTAGGRRIVVAFVGPRDIVGQAAATASGDVYLATTTACEAMEVVAWTRQTALRLSEAHPDVHARLEALLLRNAEVFLRRLQTVTHTRVPQRLADALLELVARHGRRTETAIEIAPRVTREDLADLTGTTLYTVSRILAEWQRLGILTSRRGRLRVVAPSELRRLARGAESTKAED